MDFHIYVDIGSEIPLSLSPIHRLGRAMEAVHFFRDQGHDVRMVVIDRHGKAVVREYKGIHPVDSPSVRRARIVEVLEKRGSSPMDADTLDAFVELTGKEPFLDIGQMFVSILG